MVNAINNRLVNTRRLAVHLSLSLSLSPFSKRASSTAYPLDRSIEENNGASRPARCKSAGCVDGRDARNAIPRADLIPRE